MSRSMSSAQIIAQGDYLNADFEAKSLTISQLLGIMGFHGVSYPSVYSKPKLVDIFNSEIKPKATKFKKERLKHENSLASDDGIRDGITGQPIGGDKPVPVRRSSRRLSRVPSMEVQETSPTRPDPPKRRRSSAQPNLGGPSRKAVEAHQPILVEESEPAEEELPVRKVGRSKKTSAGAQARRASGPDSGWEDNNIFQSGVESSSPLRPSPVRAKSPRKSSVVTRKTRKSTSAPPQLPPSSPPTPHAPAFSQVKEEEEEEDELDNVKPLDDDVFIRHKSPSPLRHRTPPPQPSPFRAPPLSASRLASPPQAARFAPRLPSHLMSRRRDSEAEVRRIALSPGSTSFQPLNHSDDEEDENLEDQTENLQPAENEEPEAAEASEQECEIEEEGDEHTLAVSKRLARGAKAYDPSPRRSWSSLFFYLVALSTAVSSALYGNSTREEQRAIGFCDTGKDVNSQVLKLREDRKAGELCRIENATSYADAGGMLHDCPSPPFFPWPVECTPCPAHATCSSYSVECNTGFKLKPHPALFLLPPSPNVSYAVSIPPLSQPGTLVWTLVSKALDGVPGLGSVAFPPSCVEDWKHERHIHVIRRSIEKYLAGVRGERLCAGTTKPELETDGGEGRRWGVSVRDLHNAIYKDTPETGKVDFDDKFYRALSRLIEVGAVNLTESVAGERFYVNNVPDMGMTCKLKVASRTSFQAYRAHIGAFLASLVAIWMVNSKMTNSVIQKKRVGELVQIALDVLRNQELAHYTDPITTPHAYLSSLQLRDDILQDEHSIPARKRLWDPVERVIEGNANVRVNMEEVDGGDEMRVWRWVGGGSKFRKVIQQQSDEKQQEESTYEDE